MSPHTCAVCACDLCNKLEPIAMHFATRSALLVQRAPVIDAHVQALHVPVLCVLFQRTMKLLFKGRCDANGFRL